MKGQIGNMMQQVQRMQQDMQRAQEELANIEVVGQAGGGAVKVTMTARMDVRRVQIDPAMMDTLVFGYIDLGVANTTGPLSNFAIAEIVQRADWWLNEVGADGIFLDDYGYDFCVSRQRQNDAIAGIRALSTGAPIPIVANAFRPDDVFGTQTTHAFATPWCDATVPDPVFVPNPGQIASLLSADDYYFYESHQLINGDFEANDYAFDWQFKSQYLANAQASLDFGILSTTTIDGADVYDELAFFYSWYSAALYGHDATGWGEVLFSAPTSQAPFRARPAVDVGDVFLTSPGQSVDFVEWSRDTDAGRIWIDTQTHESGFVPEPAAGAALAAGLLGLQGLARLRRRGGAGSPARRAAARRPDRAANAGGPRSADSPG